MARTDDSPPTLDSPRPSLRRRTLVIPTLLSFAVAGLFILLMLIRFDIDLGDAWRKARAADPGLLALAFVLYYLTFPLRGYRWRLLLDNVGAFKGPDRPRPSIVQTSELILVSWFTNSISWFRLGDAYRAYMLADRWKISFPTGIGTVVAERVVDIGVVVALLLVAGVGLLQGDTAETAGAVIVGASAVAAVAGAALVAMWLFGLRAARFLPRRLQRAYSRFRAGTLGSFRHLPWLVAISASIWLLEAARLFFVLEALDLEVSLALILFAALAHSLLTTIPLSPGGVGFVEAGLTGLLVLALPRDTSAGVTLLDRSITYFSILVVGGAVFALRQAIAMKRAARERIGGPPEGDGQ